MSPLRSDRSCFGNVKRAIHVPLCAKMRKGALVKEALDMGCNKIAYAHHKDDFVETMLMSLIFQEGFYAFPPVTWFEDTGLQILRPLMLAEERQVRSFCRKYEIPGYEKSPARWTGPPAGRTPKNCWSQICMEHPGAKDRMFHALTRGKIEDWPPAFSGNQRGRKERSLRKSPAWRPRMQELARQETGRAFQSVILPPASSMIREAPRNPRLSGYTPGNRPPVRLPRSKDPECGGGASPEVRRMDEYVPEYRKEHIRFLFLVRTGSERDDTGVKGIPVRTLIGTPSSQAPCPRTA